MPIDYNDWKEFIQGNLNCKLRQDEGYSNKGEPFCIRLDTQTLINSLDGESKQFVLDIAREQAEKYGNTNVWSARIYEYQVEIDMGEWFIGVYFSPETHNATNWVGNARGSKLELQLLQIAKELHQQLQDL